MIYLTLYWVRTTRQIADTLNLSLNYGVKGLTINQIERRFLDFGGFKSISMFVSRIHRWGANIFLFYCLLVRLFNFLSNDQLTKKKDRILIKDLISNKWKYKTKKQGWFYDPEEGRPCLPKYWLKDYIFPTVKSSLLFLSYIIRLIAVSLPLIRYQTWRHRSKIKTILSS